MFVVEFLVSLPLWLLAVVLNVWLMGFALAGLWFVRRYVLPGMRRDYNDAFFAAAIVTSAMLLYGLIAALTARLPRKTLLIALMIAFTVGNAATVLAPSYGLLVASRFVAGLPHGAYFGVAALVAAHLAGRGQRARAVALVMMGLSVANVVGVPVASWLGMALGWRSAFALVAVIGTVTVAAIAAWVPTLAIRTTSVRTDGARCAPHSL